MNEIIRVDESSESNASILIPDDASGDQLSRLSIYADWLNRNAGSWMMPNLSQYRDYLLSDYEGRNGSPLAPSSVKVHLATIRARLAEIARDNDTRNYIMNRLPAEMPFIEKQAYMNEILVRLNNALNPKKSAVKETIVQDEDERDFIRLSKQQAETLMRKPFGHPGNTPLSALRDSAILSLMLSTGIREMELVNLNVEDLRGSMNGELSLVVRRGKGAKQRLVPYGELDGVLVLVERWMKAAGIQSGAVFRAFYKGSKRVRPSRISKRAINDILDKYQIVIDGQLKSVNPHDLRRTYACRMHDAGVEILRIAQNLGHADTKTTLGYIGELDASARRAPHLFDIPLDEPALMI